MNQKFLSGLTAALLVSTLGVVPSSNADPSEAIGDPSGVANGNSGIPDEAGSAGSAPRQLERAASAQAVRPDAALDRKVSSPIQVLPTGEFSSPASSVQAAPSLTLPRSAAQSVEAQSVEARSIETVPVEAVKVGAYQSQLPLRTDAVATIQSHAIDGRQAATLYIRNIPVLTFLGAARSADASAPEAESGAVRSGAARLGAESGVESGAEVKIASVQSAPAQQQDKPTLPEPSVADSPDPVWRATATAARLNQLHRDSVNASEIKITWDNDRRSYVIKANEVEVIVCNADTVLPDTIESSAGDLLQATNRIRRQMGNAQPLSSIEGDPNGFNQVSIGPISLRISGYASWYGPGFDGSYSASGERFNAEALTAAHPSLPFGTQIRVTNMDNGESVVVRVNDRGPFAHDRVIDLSAGAARVIGLIQAGVAPVRLEVLGVAQAASR